jgi:hypothetical protein
MRRLRCWAREWLESLNLLMAFDGTTDSIAGSFQIRFKKVRHLAQSTDCRFSPKYFLA